MTKLTDTQCVLLSAAAQRDTMSIYPLPDSLKPGGGLQKSLAALITHGFTEERETTDKAAIAREDGDLGFGVFATAAGFAAIGIEPESGELDGTTSPPATPVVPKPVAVGKLTKAAGVLTLLQRPEGATLADLIAATSWLPHTTRAALTGIRKKGHIVDKAKRGDETCYFVRAA